MKKVLLFLFAMAICVNIYAQDGGMKFSQDDWETVLATAKKQDKLIFIDAYAVWCGPCKTMSKKIFPLKEVGDVYNANFINVKIDMEKGEGRALAKKYKVRAYPTFLFVNSDGELVHRGVGSQPAAKFVSLGKAAANPNMQLVTLQKQFDKGNREGIFMLNYINALTSAGMDAKVVTNEYLSTQEDLTSDANMELVFNTTRSMEAKGFDIMVENKEAFYKKFTKERAQGLMDYIIQGAHRGNLEKMTECYVKIFPEESEKMVTKYKVQHYMYDKGADANKNFEKAALAYMKASPSENPQELNAIAWHAYEVSEDKKMLKKALKWAKKSVKLRSQYMNNDTLAALYFKLKKKKKAIQTANLAIKLAGEEGVDAGETEALLKKIQAL